MSNAIQYDGKMVVGFIDGTPVHLNIFGADHVAMIHKAIDAYLNTRCDAPKWLFDLSDELNPVKVPERRSVDV